VLLRAHLRVVALLFALHEIRAEFDRIGKICRARGGERMRIVVRLREKFCCPFCGRRYWLEEDEGVPLICHPPDSPVCEHLDTEVLPTGESEWEVYFVDPESES
jgi:hypothetical protein